MCVCLHRLLKDSPLFFFFFLALGLLRGIVFPIVKYNLHSKTLLLIRKANSFV